MYISSTCIIFLQFVLLLSYSYNWFLSSTRYVDLLKLEMPELYFKIFLLLCTRCPCPGAHVQVPMPRFWLWGCRGVSVRRIQGWPISSTDGPRGSSGSTSASLGVLGGKQVLEWAKGSSGRAGVSNRAEFQPLARANLTHHDRFFM